MLVLHQLVAYIATIILTLINTEWFAILLVVYIVVLRYFVYLPFTKFVLFRLLSRLTAIFTMALEHRSVF